MKYLKVKTYLKDAVIKPEAAARLPTVRDLMALFNVSLATVNRALSELEHEGLIVRRQGAGITRAGKSGSIAQLRQRREQAGKNLIFIHIDYPDETIWNMTHIVDMQARVHRCGMIDCKIYQDTPTEMIVQFIRKQPDCIGVILQLGADRLDAERLRALGALPLKVVVVDSQYFYEGTLPNNVYVVMPDPVESARNCVGELLGKGHRRIGFIRNETKTDYTEAFQKTVTDQLKKAGAEFGPDYIFSTTIRSWENSKDAAVQLTEANIARFRERRLTALIYTSTSGAIVSVRPLLQAGFRIPEDISLISERERSLCRYLSPQLTISSVAYEQMGKLAVNIVVGKALPPDRRILLPGRLLARESVRDLTQKPSGS